MTIVATHAINKRESLRSELIERHGRTVIRIGRWKANREGQLRPAGASIECSADHIDGFSSMLAATKKHLNPKQKPGAHVPAKVGAAGPHERFRTI